MSFSYNAKLEICKTPINHRCCAVAEAYGMLLYATNFSYKEIKIVTGNSAIVRRVTELFKKAFGIKPMTSGTTSVKNILIVDEERDLRKVFEILGYDYKNYLSYHLNRNIIEEDCCRVSFLRGVFLSAGTVASPDKKCHLEISTNHQSLSREVMSLMLDMSLSPKLTVRRASSVLYFKDTTSVEDFLTLLGASHSAMAIMEAKVEKEIRNNINRQVNCETANLIKSTDAAAKQIIAIKKVIENQGIEFFPQKLHETIRLRIENPTLSLSELAELFNPPISKPGLSHRIRKIMQLAQSYKE